MRSVMLVTAPYSGTHFMAYALHLLGADFVFTHCYTARMRRIRKLWSSDRSMIVTTRNPWSSLFSAFNRRRLEETTSSTSGPAMTEAEIFERQMARIERLAALREEFSALTVPIDAPPSDPVRFTDQLAAFCGVQKRVEARTFIAAWPVTASVEYAAVQQPNPPVGELTQRITALCRRLGYSETSNWADFVQAPRTGPTREELGPLLHTHRATTKIGGMM